MNIAFFEVQPWEERILQKVFPQAFFSHEPLTAKHIDILGTTEILSCFIYSQLHSDILQQLPSLRCICTRSTGYDHIDIAYCKKHNITVSNVPDYGSHTVAEHTFALILTLTRKIHQSINQAKELNFDHSEIKGMDLYGKTIGVIGLGKIGKEVVKIANGFGMKVLVYSKSHHLDLQNQYRFTYTDLPTLLKTSDIITLHVPYSPETHHLLNINNIMLCKKGSYLINTARGGLIDTQALIKGLQENIFAGIGLDVLEEEKNLTDEIDILSSAYQETTNLKTLILDHHLMHHPKVIITPHNAFNSQEALMNILEVTTRNIQAYMEGIKHNTVSD